MGNILLPFIHPASALEDKSGKSNCSEIKQIVATLADLLEDVIPSDGATNENTHACIPWLT
jgi:hypothetical protein